MQNRFVLEIRFPPMRIPCDRSVPIFFLILLLGPAGCGGSSKAARTWQVATQGVFSAAFSSRYVLVGSVDGGADLWDLQKNAHRYAWRHGEERSDGIIAVAISKNEKYAITAQRNSLVWWRIRDGRVMGSWQLDSIHAVSLSRDGQFALIGLADRAIYFALGYAKTLFEFEHEAPVTATDLSSNGHFALTGSRDRTAKLWRLTDGRNQHVFKHRFEIASVALGPADRYAFTSESLGEARLWSIESGRIEKTIGSKRMTVSAASFAPDGKHLATGGASRRIDLWDLRSGRDIHSWRPRKTDFWRPSAATVVALGFTNRGRNLLSASSNGTAQLWRTY